MTHIQKQFFALLRSGLWGTPADASLFDEQTDWKQLMQFAKKQALLGIIFDGVRTLPDEKQPQRALHLQWCNVLMQIEETNELLNRELANVYDLYRANGIEPILMKGQGVAQNYRNPLHRHSGDIDLYIGKVNYDLANQLLFREGTSKHEESFKHTSIRWHGVDIENHRVLSRLSAPQSDRHLQQDINRYLNPAHCCKLPVGTCQVSVPSPSFDAAYLLLHSIIHFLSEGIGLRQVCDWTCLLYAQRENIDRKEVAEILQKWGLTEGAKAFGAIATRYLGLPGEFLILPCEQQDLKTGDWLLDDIWKGGNFGKFDNRRKQRPEGYWQGKWNTYTHILNRCRELGALAPVEARWYPFKLLLYTFQTQANKLKKRPESHRN